MNQRRASNQLNPTKTPTHTRMLPKRGSPARSGRRTKNNQKKACACVQGYTRYSVGRKRSPLVLVLHFLSIEWYPRGLTDSVGTTAVTWSWRDELLRFGAALYLCGIHMGSSMLRHEFQKDWRSVAISGRWTKPRHTACYAAGCGVIPKKYGCSSNVYQFCRCRGWVGYNTSSAALGGKIGLFKIQDRSKMEGLKPVLS